LCFHGQAAQQGVAWPHSQEWLGRTAMAVHSNEQSRQDKDREIVEDDKKLNFVSISNVENPPKCQMLFLPNLFVQVRYLLILNK